MRQIKSIIACFLLSSMLLASVQIAPNNTLIQFYGVFNYDTSATVVTFHRITESTITHPLSDLDRRRSETQSGIIIKFRSNSPIITAKFIKLDGEARGLDFGVFQNGIWDRNFNGSTNFTITSKSPGDTITFEIVLPSLHNVAFKGLTIEDSAKLFPLDSEEKPVYVAIGNSITHGVGQGSASYKSYPFLLARKAGWELYNLGVSAARISPPVAYMTKNHKVDVISILIGYNDWNRIQDLSLYKNKYKMMLDSLRSYHPKAQIYCMTVFTTNPQSAEGTTYSINDYNNAIRNLVTTKQDEGDTSLFLIEGSNIVETADLTDLIHLNVNGAANVAKRLYQRIVLNGNIPNSKKLIFRYNATMSDSSFISEVDSNNITIDHSSDNADENVRSEAGWGLKEYNVAHFSTPTSSIFTPNTININSDSVSGDLWFNPMSEGALLSWSDQDNGLFIKIENNRLYFTTLLNGKNIEATSDSMIYFNKNQHISWDLYLNDENLVQTMYLNGDTIINKETPVSVSQIQINAPVYLGANSSLTYGSESFVGELSAATLKNYLPNTIYHQATIPDDGTATFGIATYHDLKVNMNMCSHGDYPVGTEYKNTDLRFSESTTEVTNLCYIPYLDDGYCPQGMSSSLENSDSTALPADYKYLLMVHQSPSGMNEKPPIIVEFSSSQNSRINRCFRVMGNLSNRHITDISVWQDKIFVIADNLIETYSLPTLDSPKYLDIFPTKQDMDTLSHTGSFLTTFQDTLWIGQTAAHDEETPYIFAYPINDSGQIVNSENPFFYQIPYYTEGILWQKFWGDSKTYLFAMVSNPGLSSKLKRFNKPDLSPTDEAKTKIYAYFPTSSQDITVDKNGIIYSVPENASKYHQLYATPASENFFPFIYGIDESVSYDGITITNTDIEKPEMVPHKFSLSLYPNPFNAHLTISYNIEQKEDVAINIYNLLGEHIEELYNSHQDMGSHKIRWNASAYSTGVYFLSVTVGYHRKVQKVVLLK